MNQKTITLLVSCEGEVPTLKELQQAYTAVVVGAHESKTKAAEALGIDRRTLYRYLGKKEVNYG